MYLIDNLENAINRYIYFVKFTRNIVVNNINILTPC